MTVKEIFTGAKPYPIRVMHMILGLGLFLLHGNILRIIIALLPQLSTACCIWLLLCINQTLWPMSLVAASRIQLLLLAAANNFSTLSVAYCGQNLIFFILINMH